MLLSLQVGEEVAVLLKRSQSVLLSCFGLPDAARRQTLIALSAPEAELVTM